MTREKKEAHPKSSPEAPSLALDTLAPNASSVISGLPQYPAATDGDDSQSSPTSPTAISRLVTGSTIINCTRPASRVAVGKGGGGASVIVS